MLIRSRHEASLIRDALGLLNIPSVYLSNRDSVFDTPEAQELLWLLQAVLAPERENTLRSALATSMLGLSALDIETLNQTKPPDAIVEEFAGWRDMWLKRGVMPMLHALMSARHVAENLLATPGGERRLTDILHLSELLQEAGTQVESEHALVRWLAQHIAEPDANSSSEQLRLESDKHLVKIVTIHKSKGLEYPLVWLPFIANFRVQDQAFYHDRTSFAPVLDLSKAEESIELAETERGGRSASAVCGADALGLALQSGNCPISRRRGEKTGDSDFHLNALGRLIQQGQPRDAQGLRACVEALCNDNIALCMPDVPDNVRWQAPQDVVQALTARQMTRTIRDDWRVTSYSGLQQRAHGIAQDLLPRLDLDAAGERDLLAEPMLTPHQFPRGASPGTFLHSLFEDLDFTQPIAPARVAEKLQRGGFEEHWQPVISEWIDTILHVPRPIRGRRCIS